MVFPTVYVLQNSQPSSATPFIISGTTRFNHTKKLNTRGRLYELMSLKPPSHVSISGVHFNQPMGFTFLNTSNRTTDVNKNCKKQLGPNQEATFRKANNIPFSLPTKISFRRVFTLTTSKLQLKQKEAVSVKRINFRY